MRFYAAGNAANNNGTETGDRIYTANIAVAEAATTPPPGAVAGNTVIPQFVFGGGWYTAIYFTNSSSAQVSFPVRFYTDAANDMPVNGSATRQMIIPALGSAIIEAQNRGDLVQGWATFDLPAGVSGYSVFRQSVAGRADQEAVTPFANSAATHAIMTFDEAPFTTAIAIWYNGLSNATITITARDEAGLTLGTTSFPVTPGNKQSFVVSGRIATIAGKRGSLEFTTSNGAFSVLGIRFGGSSFTSIPPAP